MKSDADLENASASGEACEQDRVCESSVGRPPDSEAASAATAPQDETRDAVGPDEGPAKPVITQRVEPSVEAAKEDSVGETSGGDRVGASRNNASSPPIASSDAAVVNSLGDALAALDRRDYATAKRLFAALGRTEAAEAIDTALAALDRKDYATAQGLFEALAPPALIASTGRPTVPDSSSQVQEEQAASPIVVAPIVDEDYRQPPPQAEQQKRRGLKPLWIGAGLALLALVGASALYVSQRSGPFAAANGQATTGPTAAVDLVKAFFKGFAGSGGRDAERSELRDLRAALAEATTRLDQIEQEYGARLDKLGEGVDPNSSSKFAEVTARLDALEKEPAAPAATASELADVAARLDKLEKRSAIPAPPAPDIVDLKTRLDRLEKRAAVAAASSAAPLSAAGQKQSTLVARAQPPARNETARPAARTPLLQDYAVEDGEDGIAVIDSRFGAQQVAPGDFIPGAGRVLRIERRGGGWLVLTSNGVIAGGPAPY
jgi:hypothetical protein